MPKLFGHSRPGFQTKNAYRRIDSPSIKRRSKEYGQVWQKVGTSKGKPESKIVGFADMTSARRSSDDSISKKIHWGAKAGTHLKVKVALKDYAQNLTITHKGKTQKFIIPAKSQITGTKGLTKANDMIELEFKRDGKGEATRWAPKLYAKDSKKSTTALDPGKLSENNAFRESFQKENNLGEVTQDALKSTKGYDLRGSALPEKPTVTLNTPALTDVKGLTAAEQEEPVPAPLPRNILIPSEKDEETSEELTPKKIIRSSDSEQDNSDALSQASDLSLESKKSEAKSQEEDILIPKPEETFTPEATSRAVNETPLQQEEENSSESVEYTYEQFKQTSGEQASGEFAKNDSPEPLDESDNESFKSVIEESGSVADESGNESFQTAPAPSSANSIASQASVQLSDAQQAEFDALEKELELNTGSLEIKVTPKASEKSESASPLSISRHLDSAEDSSRTLFLEKTLITYDPQEFLLSEDRSKRSLDSSESKKKLNPKMVSLDAAINEFSDWCDLGCQHLTVDQDPKSQGKTKEVQDKLKSGLDDWKKIMLYNRGHVLKLKKRAKDQYASAKGGQDKAKLNRLYQQLDGIQKQYTAHSRKLDQISEKIKVAQANSNEPKLDNQSKTQSKGILRSLFSKK